MKLQYAKHLGDLVWILEIENWILFKDCILWFDNLPSISSSRLLKHQITNNKTQINSNERNFKIQKITDIQLSKHFMGSFEVL